MGGTFRPAVITASALALLAIASPAAVLIGPLAARHVAAAPADSKDAHKGKDHAANAAPATYAPAGAPAANQEATAPVTVPAASAPSVASSPAAGSASANRELPAQIQLSKPRAGQPSERADHASPGSHGLHAGAGTDPDVSGTRSPSSPASTSSAASSGAPASGTQAVSTRAVGATPPHHPGATPAPPPVAVEPPAVPQPNPPLSTQPALTGARLDWILVGVVVALAAAVVAAVRVATLRGRHPPR